MYKIFGKPNLIAIDVMEYSDKLSTGPALTDPAARGAPGFNEFYYLRNNKDAAAAVRVGQYNSGLDHYLKVGRAEGRPGHAPSGRTPSAGPE
jgi:hypothetical protein